MSAARPAHLAFYGYARAMLEEARGADGRVGPLSVHEIASIGGALEESRQREPNHPDTLYLLGFLHLVTNNRLEQGVTLLEQAIALAPSRDDVAFALGQTYLRTGNLAAARRVLAPLADDADEDAIRAAARASLAVADRAQDQ
jgi:thioredoxin-like negative regulator of GroEL